MTLFSLISLISVALVAAQLAAVQHAALMELFRATGVSALIERVDLFFFFFFTRDPGCSTAICPRFAVNQPCMITESNLLFCDGANVVQLCANKF